MASEQRRLQEAAEPDTPWKKWGPYLSERQWGTVREDYSETGDAWNYFPHDQARSRAYRWGEDGLAGISDDRQRLCFALALWNGADPIIKERLFGLTNTEGNHGEDVKEYYFYLDSTPTHSYMKYLYKYPQRAYPYGDLVATNRQRTGRSRSTSCSTRASSTRTATSTSSWSTPRRLPRTSSSASGRPTAGPRPRRLHLLPTLWFRNTWSWSADAPRPSLRQGTGRAGVSAVVAPDPGGREYASVLRGRRAAAVHRERDERRAPVGHANATPYVKDAHRQLRRARPPRGGEPRAHGHQGGRPLHARVEAGATAVVRLRLTASPADAIAGAPSVGDFDATFARASRRPTPSTPPSRPPHDRGRALWSCGRRSPGMLWSKQYYHYDVERVAARARGSTRRNPRLSRSATGHWAHMANEDVISMPDKWEYPWYAAWDLAFHTVALALVDLRLRQAAAPPHARAAVPAPERPDPRLRVELRRRQSAGARLGRLVHLPAGEASSAARATSTSSSRSSRSSSSISPGG